MTPMEPFDLSDRTMKPSTYQVSKKLFWSVLLLITAVLIVLFSLTIYFGVRPKNPDALYYKTTRPLLTTHGQHETTISNGLTILPPLRPVRRIPANLKPELYQWTITPDLIDETFTGDLLYTFTCLEATNELILHMADLLIDNSTIAIINSSSSSMPIFHSWSYDDYNQFMILNFSSTFIPETTYTLRIVYSASIDRDLEGLYLSDYVDVNGISRTFLTSQMEPTYARSALPCVDEPARKAIFRISVRHDPLHAVWTNGELERTETLTDDRILSHFAPTLNMSTFLLALIVAPKSDFACRPDHLVGSKQTKSRVCGRVQILPQLTYADEVAFKVLKFFNQYFDIDYPLPKIEHFAVPDFEGGAMENYGLLIYGEVGLLFDEKTGSTSLQQYVTGIIAHEIAHQWFGNLVSPAWWGELWLKEGFASYMEAVASDFVEPLWMQEELFVVEKIFSFMEADSLPTSRSISVESTNPADIFLMFDTITYDKGAALIRMMNMFLGAKTFQQGIRNYLKALSYSSATQQDLWRYLSQAANNTIEVERIMDGWTRQAGYPIVEVNRVYAKADGKEQQQQQQRVEGELVITQQPFSLFPLASKQEKWWIPFKYFDRTSLQLSADSPIIWLSNTSTRLPLTTSDSDWILANPDYFGIYRTKYDPQNFDLILTQLETDHTRIPTITRGALIDDTFALSRTSLVNITDAYKLLRYLKNERDFVPWIAVFSAMDQQEDFLTGSEILPEVQHYFLELALPLYNSIGWTPINQSIEWRRALLQPNVLSTVCHYGYRECIDAARSAYRRWNLNPARNSIPVSLRSTVYCVVVQEGSQSEFKFLWERLKHELNPSETVSLLYGLACTKDSSRILWFLNQHLNNESVIRDQDMPRSIQNVARSSHGNHIVWIWIRETWSQLFEKWGKSDSGLGNIIKAVTSRFVTVRQRDEFQMFANSITDKGTAYRQFQLSLDKINAAIAWNTANLASITAFIRSMDDSSTTSHLVVPIHYDLYVKPYLNITDDHYFSVFDGRVRIHVNITRATDRIVLHKRFITIREPIEITGGASVIRTTFNQDRDLFTIIFDRTIPINTQTIITLNYVGELNNDTAGFYLTSYVRSSDKVRRYLVASQMAPISARRALPCFDEPAFKATFAVTVEHERQYRAWSNMPELNETNLENGLVLTQFQTSVPMSSYLLALVVADFDCLTRNGTGRYGNITTSVCGQSEKKDYLNYALEVATTNIRNFEEQYQINYPLPKCDHIAVPDLDIAAMENFGCIIYHETWLFYNNRTSTSSDKQMVALIIAHELSHQWFGNLVSPGWWDNIWLNEGFAHWMQFVATNKVHPEWDLYEQFLAHEWFPVMQNDAISFSHPVIMQITHDEQLATLFDTITYSKGSSLVRMLRNFMTDETFNRGVSNYLARHLYSTANQTDLWRALNEQMVADNVLLPSNISLNDIMSTWTDQMGYPYVQVTRDYTANTVLVTQHQFLFDSEAQPPKSAHNYRWYIPLKFKSLSSPSSNITWFNQAQINVTTSTSVQSNEWLLANPNLLGFFRTNYDARNWRMIIEQLKSGHENFTVSERAGLIDDVFNLARANILQVSLVFDLLTYARSERAYIVWKRILAGISYIEQMIASSYSSLDFDEQLRSYLVDLILPIYTILGWEDQSMTDKWLDVLHRDMILSTACRYNLDDCIQHAQHLFQQWLDRPSNNSIEPNRRMIVYCTNVRLGNRVPFQFLLREYQASNDRQEKARIQLALTCTRDIGLIRYLLETHLNPQANIVRRQDSLSGIRSICRNSVAVTECWSFVRSRWKQLFQNYGQSLDFAEFMRDLTGQFNTEQQLDDFERFAEQTTDKGAAEAEFHASIERIRANIQWVEKVKPNLEQWFTNRTLAIHLTSDGI